MAKKSSEAPPCYVIRDGDRLIGEMEMDREMIRQFPAGQRIAVELSTGRYPPRLRFYRAFLNEVVKATGAAPNADILHEAVKLGSGFTHDVKFRGHVIKVPASIAFKNMDEPTFTVFLNAALAFIASEYGITPEDVERAA
jgi:hypothetical protein